MKLHSLFEAANAKIGIVPFLPDGRCLFAIMRNSGIGNSDPIIAIAQAPNNTPNKEDGVVIGINKLGMMRSNLAAEPFLGWKGELAGADTLYPLEVYAVLVKDEDAFSAHDKAFSRTIWLNSAEFKAEGQKAQKNIMNKIFNKIDTYLK